MWMFPRIGGFPPKSSILIGFSIINHPFWGTPIFGNTHVGIRIVDVYGKCTINIIPVPWIRHGYRKREKKLGSSKHLITKEYKTEHCCRLKKKSWTLSYSSTFCWSWKFCQVDFYKHPFSFQSRQLKTTSMLQHSVVEQNEQPKKLVHASCKDGFFQCFSCRNPSQDGI